MTAIYHDIHQMKRDAQTMRETRLADDLSRGYSLVKPTINPAFALELLRQTETEMRPFLTRYAKLVFDANKVISVDDTARLEEWRSNMRIVFLSGDNNVCRKSFCYQWALNEVINSQTSGISADALSRLIYERLEDTKQSISSYSATEQDYKYFYEVEYEKMKGVSENWDSLRLRKSKAN